MTDRLMPLVSRATIDAYMGRPNRLLERLLNPGTTVNNPLPVSNGCATVDKLVVVGNVK